MFFTVVTAKMVWILIHHLEVKLLPYKPVPSIHLTHVSEANDLCKSLSAVPDDQAFQHRVTFHLVYLDAISTYW